MDEIIKEKSDFLKEKIKEISKAIKKKTLIDKPKSK